MRNERERFEELAEDVRRFVFEQLDAEPEIGGGTAGDIAARVEAAFLAACSLHGFGYANANDAEECTELTHPAQPCMCGACDGRRWELGGEG